ncbi:hypothetical protein [Bacillus thuringiensis]|nr:hypothetical protein [Bacillus thuringiensis]
MVDVDKGVVIEEVKEIFEGILVLEVKEQKNKKGGIFVVFY